MKKFFFGGLMLGVLLAVFGYESQQFQRTSTLGVQPSEDRLAYFSFYENLYHTSVTVIEDVYGDVDHAQPEQSKNLSVQLGSFSRKESAEAFRARVILEGYMPSDIIVQPASGYFRVVIGPFAHREEAELAMGWAEKRNFSSLLIASS